MIQIKKVNGLDRDIVKNHLINLSRDDIQSRFGYYISPEKLEEYCQKINFNRDIALGAYNEKEQLVGFCHAVGFTEEGSMVADVGLTVSSSERGGGVGYRLLQAMLDMAHNYGMAKIYIYTIKNNAPMQALLKKFNGEIIREGDEVKMCLELKEVLAIDQVEHFIDEDGIEVIKKHVNQHAENILFIHGAGGDAWQWRVFFMPYFAARSINTLAISLPNHGQSKKDKEYKIDDYIGIIKKWNDKLGPKTIIVGHSMGGFLTQKYAADHQISNKIILLASMPPFNPENLEGGFLSLIQEELKCNQARYHLNQLLVNESSVNTENIVSPVICVAGRADKIIPMQWNKKVSHHYRAPLYTVEGGHNLMLGRHWELVANLLAEQFPAKKLAENF